MGRDALRPHLSDRHERQSYRRTVKALVCLHNADVAQLVEHHLAKVRVAGSNPVVRSSCPLQPAQRHNPGSSISLAKDQMTTCQGEGPRSGSFVCPRSEALFRVPLRPLSGILSPVVGPTPACARTKKQKGDGHGAEKGNVQQADDYDERVPRDEPSETVPVRRTVAVRMRLVGSPR